MLMSMMMPMPMEHPPYPLHKGDLVCARGILVYALRSFAALRMTITQDAKAGEIMNKNL